jgi:hypothetical protein
MISAKIWRPNTDFTYSGPFLFVVDSGADHSFIVPHDEQLLGVARDNLVEVGEDAHTFVGSIKLLALPHCSIVLNDFYNAPHVVSDISICFIDPRDQKKLKPFATDGAFPSVLGRDVLDKLSMGYCKRSSYLFLTDDADRYYTKLRDHFPKPNRFDEDVIPWMPDC